LPALSFVDAYTSARNVETEETRETGMRVDQGAVPSGRPRLTVMACDCTTRKGRKLDKFKTSQPGHTSSRTY
jgi:hypothetical protein